MVDMRLSVALIVVLTSMVGVCNCKFNVVSIDDGQSWERVRERLLANHLLAEPSTQGTRRNLAGAQLARGIPLGGSFAGFIMHPTKVITGRPIKCMPAGLSLCINSCRDDASCLAVSWCASTLTCTLKAEVISTTFNATTDSFSKTGVDVTEPAPCPVDRECKFARIRNADVVGGRLGYIKGSNLKACVEYCQSVCACKGFVLYQGFCYMKWSVNEPIMSGNRTLYVVPAVYNAEARAMDKGFLGVNTGDGYKMTYPQIASWCKVQNITRLKLFHSYQMQIRNLTNFKLIIGIENANLYKYAAEGTGVIAAQQYVAKYVQPYPHVCTIAVGNEALASWNTKYAALVAPAMKNLAFALRAVGLSRVKVTTPLDYGCLFQSGFTTRFAPILETIRSTGAPFVVNLYPHIACVQNSNIRLDFCLGTQYNPTASNPTSMLDAQYREAQKVLAKMNATGIEVVVGETGWPSRGSNSMYTIANQGTYLDSTARFAQATRRGVYLFQLQDGSTDAYGMLTNPGATPKGSVPSFF